MLSSLGLCIVLLGLEPAVVQAFESLFDQMPLHSNNKAVVQAAQHFPDAVTQTDLEEGGLIGTGTERIRHLPDGGLSIERRRHYTAVRRADTQAVAKLPEPWEAVSSLLLSPDLRVKQIDTRVDFKKATGDRAFADYKLSEKQAWMFEADHTSLRAIEEGRRLQMQVYLRGKLVKQEQLDYPVDTAPFDIVPLYMSLALARGIEHFDLQVLFPGEGTHGVSVRVQRTRDLAQFAKGYRLPQSRLKTPQPVAVMDMSLASPIKALIFPYHYFMVFSIAHPERLLMMWGGKSDSFMASFQRP